MNRGGRRSTNPWSELMQTLTHCHAHTQWKRRRNSGKIWAGEVDSAQRGPGHGGGGSLRGETVMTGRLGRGKEEEEEEEEEKFGLHIVGYV